MHFHILLWDIGSLVSTFCVFICALPSHVFGRAAEGARPEKRLGVNFCAVKLQAHPTHPLINECF